MKTYILSAFYVFLVFMAGVTFACHFVSKQHGHMIIDSVVALYFGGLALQKAWRRDGVG